MTNIILAGLVGLALGIATGYIIRRIQATKRIGSLETQLDQKTREAETKAKEIIVEAKEKAASILVDIKTEEKERKAELSAIEAKASEKEASAEKMIATAREAEAEIKKKEAELAEKETEFSKTQERVEEELSRVSGMSQEEAKDALLKEAREQHRDELAQALQKLDTERKDAIEKKSMDIIAIALQRFARTHVSELTTTLVNLPDDDLKGKIIGREGRNIRALERATGVEFVIDEAPGAVIVSSFDPYRREIAKVALEKLMKDGRIQPAKIEEKVEEAKEEINERAKEIGEAAAAEVGIYDLPKEILELLGRLHFRTSFGQNVLTHSVEMAHISGIMAAEMGLNVGIAKKGALLHDIGKAIDHEVEGTHVELGRKILKKYDIAEPVIEAMQSHHDDYPYARSEAYVVTAADVISAARPGARRGTAENYIKRLEDLERIANDFEGVNQTYAISAGRELRVFVTPEKIDDFGALELARKIANRIQAELNFPGEIKVNVIRETRAVEYAK